MSFSVRKMESMTREKMQNQRNHMVMQKSFLLCNANTGASGWPIQYASPGFCDFFQCGPNDCVGKKCGELVGGFSITNCGANMLCVANALNLDLGKLEKAIYFLKGYATNEYLQTMMSPGGKVGFVLTLSCKKDGTIFVCEVIISTLKHPNGFTYVISMQRDVSNEISAEGLIYAVFTETFADLIRTRATFVKNCMPSGEMHVQAVANSIHVSTKTVFDNLASMVNQKHYINQEYAEATQSRSPKETINKASSPAYDRKKLRQKIFCMYHLFGVCKYADRCNFAHDLKDINQRRELHNTQVCKLHLLGDCNDEQCNFAHTRGDLRRANLFDKNSGPMKMKTNDRNLCGTNDEKCSNKADVEHPTPQIRAAISLDYPMYIQTHNLACACV